MRKIARIENRLLPGTKTHPPVNIDNMREYREQREALVHPLPVDLARHRPGGFGQCLLDRE